jgi:hypothetical protein
MVLVLAASPALAEGAGSADAEELFKQGRVALEAKDYATACTKLAESNRLERAVGTLISLAQCEEAQKKLASARQHWQEAADFADALQDRLQRGPAARQRFTELDKRVPRLTVQRSPGAPAGMTVRRDEVTLLPASFGSALPVDPGKHVLIVSAESHEPRTFEVELAEGESRVIEVEPGAEVPAPPEPAPSVPAAGAVGPSASDSGSMRIAGYTLGGVGILGLGLGTIFGLRASSKWSSAKQACVPGQCGPGSNAQNDKDDASSAGTVSTMSFVVGGAALATGVVLLVLAPSSKNGSSTAEVRLVPGPGTLSAIGAF